MSSQIEFKKDLVSTLQQTTVYNHGSILKSVHGRTITFLKKLVTFFIYNTAHKDCKYFDQCVEKLVKAVSNPKTLEAITSVRITPRKKIHIRN